MRSHVGGGPVGEGAVIHLKTIVVLEHWNDVFGAGFPKEFCPGGWLELLSLKHRNKIFVAKLFLSAVSRNVVLVFFGTLDVHLARIPLTAECRHRIYPPVNKNPELGVLVPVWHFVTLE